MFKFSATFFSSKTTWTAAAAILTALVSASNHTITWPEAVAAIFAALQTAWLRDAIAK